MRIIYFAVVATALCLEVSHAQYLGRFQSYPASQSDCTCTCDDLSSLLTLIRALEEKEQPKCSCSNTLNTDDIIMQLINALIYATTQNVNNSGSTKNGGSGGLVPSLLGGKSGKPLIDLGLLQPGPNDVAILGVGGTDVLGIGLGNGANTGAVPSLVNSLI